jgi:hypothetical protein
MPLLLSTATTSWPAPARGGGELAVPAPRSGIRAGAAGEGPSSSVPVSQRAVNAGHSGLAAW